MKKARNKKGKTRSPSPPFQCPYPSRLTRSWRSRLEASLSMYACITNKTSSSSSHHHHHHPHHTHMPPFLFSKSILTTVLPLPTFTVSSSKASPPKARLEGAIRSHALLLLKLPVTTVSTKACRSCGAGFLLGVCLGDDVLG